jgi:hypothetical protein
MNIYGKDATAYYDLHNGLRLLRRGESEPVPVTCAKNDTLVGGVRGRGSWGGSARGRG